VINAPQKIGMGGIGAPGGGGVGGVGGMGGLTVTQAAMQNSGVSGVGMNSLNDPNNTLLNFNIQGSNGKSKLQYESDILTNLKNVAKVISSRPGVAGATPGSTIPDVGMYGINSNIGPINSAKINVDSKPLISRFH